MPRQVPPWAFSSIRLGAWGDNLPTGLPFAEQWGIIGLSGFFLQGIQLSATDISLSSYDTLTQSREVSALG